MEPVKKKRRKALVNQRDCVACGCCMKVCPLSAIRVVSGECPASVIEILEVEA